MKTLFLDQQIAYDGSQLRGHWILGHAGLTGDAMVAFRGPCAVRDDEMADLEDLQHGARIAGDDMVHFLWESFEQPDLLLAVHRQRLLTCQAAECLRQLGSPIADLRRSGDDLYLGDGKLSISVATRSAVSSLIHFAVNATPGGAPVRTATLQDLGVDPQQFAEDLLALAAAEQESIRLARAMVRVKGESGL